MDISAEIAAIQAASQGSELRQPLVGALNKLNTGSLPAVTASDAGKILKVGANGWEVGEKSGYMPVPTATKQITENGTYDVMDFSSAIVGVSGGGGGSGSALSGFYLCAADYGGNNRSNSLAINNDYFVCFFHDNMSNTYSLNGTNYQFAVIGTGYGFANIKADTRSVTNQNRDVNAIIERGSIFSTSHNDAGSYCSIIGGWAGYATGGDIYQNYVSANENSITMNKAYDKLLIFVGASGASVENNAEIQINGITYTITNVPAKYDGVESMYGAIELNDISESSITVSFPVSCYNYVSIIGIDAA